MPRTYVITGSASGIGQATRQLLESQGHRVIGVDLADAEIIADLATPSGREAVVEGVRASTGNRLDAVIASAGVGHETPETIQVNYFGAVAAVTGLRPLLARGTDPRAVLLSSVASLLPVSQAVVDACLAGEEEAAVIAAKEAAGQVYPSSKAALARWVRRTAVSEEWADAGIPLNAVAPGLIVTPMMEPHLAIDEVRAMLDQALPMPLGGHGRPEQVAELIAWLASPQNSMITGQVIFIDGGTDAMIRRDSTW
jgi:NAD(P)-dependent dehydrogenase (short-subunit alcohol dehydrogenase family)